MIRSDTRHAFVDLCVYDENLKTYCRTSCQLMLSISLFLPLWKFNPSYGKIRLRFDMNPFHIRWFCFIMICHELRFKTLDFEEQDLFVQVFERLYGKRDYLRIWRANQVYHLYIFWNPICTHLICLDKSHGRYTRQILRFSLHRFQENMTIICYFELSLFDLKIARYTFVIWNQVILWSINWVMRN